MSRFQVRDRAARASYPDPEHYVQRYHNTYRIDLRSICRHHLEEFGDSSWASCFGRVEPCGKKNSQPTIPHENHAGRNGSTRNLLTEVATNRVGSITNSLTPIRQFFHWSLHLPNHQSGRFSKTGPENRLGKMQVSIKARTNHEVRVDFLLTDV